MTLTEFLLARIDEDEKQATWHHRLLCLRTGCEVCVFGDDEDAIAAERVCTCGYPARVLAECKAKRQILKRAHESNGYWGRDIERAMLTPYLDHPDCRHEWWQ